MRWTAAAAAALVLAPSALAGGPSLVLGAAEDAVRSPTLVGAKAEIDLLSVAGFRAVRITQAWTPGERTVAPGDRAVLRNVVTAARLDAFEVVRASRTPVAPRLR